MSFELSDEERSLQQLVAEFAGSEFGGQRAQAGPGEWQGPWERMTGLGLTAILVPEANGGSGGTLVDACLIAEELARADAWVPFVGGAVLGVMALRSSDSPAAVRGLVEAAGGALFSLVTDSQLQLSDSPGVVGFDWRDGAIPVALSGTDARPLAAPDTIVDDSSDPFHPLARLLGADPLPPPVWTEAQRLVRVAGCVALSAWLNGLASAALRDAVAYAKQRHQFGVPIGSFQAIQHMCADMLVDVESSRSMTLGAAWFAANAELGRAERLAAAAKAWSSAAAVRVCETSIQVHGGIGITWEHVAHRRLRTAVQFSRALGSAADMHAVLADLSGKNLVKAHGSC
jgi:alkylation response protein AidB-like acyl-CoA dehydrogenase